jgi:hypothetical protein
MRKNDPLNARHAGVFLSGIQQSDRRGLPRDPGACRGYPNETASIYFKPADCASNNQTDAVFPVIREPLTVFSNETASDYFKPADCASGIQ